MRSPEARELLNEVLKHARRVAEGGEAPGFLAAALRDYDHFCQERHYSLEMDLASNSTANYLTETRTKADHFRLPTGL